MSDLGEGHGPTQKNHLQRTATSFQIWLINMFNNRMSFMLWDQSLIQISNTSYKVNINHNLSNKF